MRIGIVGGGITGLSAAHELAKAGYAVVVYERTHPGGLGGGFPFPDMDGVTIEKFYHHLFRSDHDMIALIEEMGMAGDLRWLTSRSGVWAQGRVWPLETPFDFLACRPIGSLGQRVRMALALRRFQTSETWRDLDGISCREYFARRRAADAYENFWAPLLHAKFGDAASRIPASFLWGRIHPRARSRRWGREVLGYLRGGFQRLIEALVGAIRSSGGDVRTGDAVTRLSRDGRGRPVLTASSGADAFDEVIWTIAPSLLADACDGLDQSTRGRLRAVEYMAVCCLVLVMSRRQGDYYWINSLDEETTFGGVIEHTNLVGDDSYGGRHVLYVVNYVEPDAACLAFDRRRLLRWHLPSLRRVLPAFREEDVLHAYRFTARYSSPIYDLGYAEKMPPVTGWIDRVRLTGMVRVYPEDRNMSHCIRVAKHAIRDLVPGDRLCDRGREETRVRGASVGRE
jgi:protoporphyrinogen oxidase